MPTTTDESIVIMPAVTCPADFPATVAAYRAEVDALAPLVEQLAKRIADDLLDVVDEVDKDSVVGGVDDGRLDRLAEATGWGALSDALAELAGCLLCAANIDPDNGEPDWWKDRKVRQWLDEVADPATSETRLAEVKRWLSFRQDVVARVQGQ